MTDREQTGSEQHVGGTSIDLSETVAQTHEGQQKYAGRQETIFGLKDVSVRYGGNLAVDEVSIDILQNHITAMIGPSGCGKSTLSAASTG